MASCLAPVPPRHARVGDRMLAFEEVGASRRPLVLVHGYCGSRLDFVDVRGALARRRRVLSFDQRGHGASEHRGPYSVALAMRDLEALLDHLGDEVVDLLGHSLGAAVALRFALGRPRRVRTLTLAAGTARPMSMEPYRPPRSAGWRARVRERLGRDLAWELARGLHVDEPTRHRFEAVFRFGHRAVDPVAALELAADLGRMPSMEPELGRYPGPALVLVGSEDRRFLEPSEALTEGLPGGRRVVLPDAGHFCHVEAREAWLEAVEAHLGAVTEDDREPTTG